MYFSFLSFISYSFFFPVHNYYSQPAFKRNIAMTAIGVKYNTVIWLKMYSQSLENKSKKSMLMMQLGGIWFHFYKRMLFRIICNSKADYKIHLHVLSSSVQPVPSRKTGQDRRLKRENLGEVGSLEEVWNVLQFSETFSHEEPRALRHRGQIAKMHCSWRKGRKKTKLNWVYVKSRKPSWI